MTRPRLLSLCTGFGGLGTELVAVSDIDPGACKILAHRYSGVPNLGDMTKVDWTTIQADVIAGGTPCQDLSHAGKRRGMTEGTRSNLWVSMREAIAVIRPSLVVWENVRGAYSAEADSDLEQCPRCVGDPRDRGPVLRALGRVLGDLSDLGYVGGWCGLRASDAGACHGRFRVFVVATLADSLRVGWDWRTHDTLRRTVERTPVARRGEVAAPVELLPSPRTSDANGSGRHGDGGLDLRTAIEYLPTPTTRDGKGRNQRDDDTCLAGALLPTPRATDGTKGGPNQRGTSGDLMLPSAVMQLLPTPAVTDMGRGKTVDAWDEWTARMKAEHGNGNGHGPPLEIEAMRLVPTPSVHDRATSNRERTAFYSLTKESTTTATFGKYAAAIARQETAFGHPAPPPTEPTGRDGAHRLSPRFVEWMMACEPGWVTDVPGLTRNEQLKALGNGVVRPQAAAAFRWLAHVQSERAA